MCRVDINTTLSLKAPFPFDVYVKLSEAKIVKLTLKGEDVIDRLRNYQKKGVTHVYVNKIEYKKFLAELKQSVSQKFFNPDSVIKKRSAEEIASEERKKVEALDMGFKAMKDAFFSNLGVDENVIGMAEEVSKQGLLLIKQKPNIFKFFKRFKENCSSELMNGMLVSYSTSIILDEFSWASEVIKSKASLASLLRDIILSPEEFEEIKNDSSPWNNLSKRALEHPVLISKLLNNHAKMGIIPHEALLIIEQHHERPDGKGFPHGINYKRINQLAAIHIVADSFIQLLVKNNFDFQKKDQIFSELEEIYFQGSFRKAFSGLVKAINS